MSQTDAIGIVVFAQKIDDELVASLASISHQTTNTIGLLSVPQQLSASALRVVKENSLSQHVRVVACESDDSTALAYYGVAKQETDFIGFLLPGDVLAPAFCERTLQVCHTLNVDAVVSDVRLFGSARAILPARLSSASLLASPWLPSGFMCKKHRLQAVQSPAQLGLAHTFLTDLLIRLSSANKIAAINEPLYFHRTKPGNAINPESIRTFMDANESLYKQNWQEVLAEKDALLKSLSEELAPAYENLKQDHEKLEAKYDVLNEKYQSLEEHHSRALSSIKVTGIHLLRAIFARISPGRG